ncbi:MAG TPA: heme biosynthesis HemY N-terminal domain-containing protein [Thiolinea sp.]|nr:heme biosynthesis HemY N-terminal domain-containing protein [Thiolinea sp.]
MIRTLLVLLILGGVVYLLMETVLSQQGNAVISWGVWSVEMRTATLALAVFVMALLFHVFVTLLHQLLGLRKRLQRRQQARLTSRANRNLSLGLMQMAEGDWDKAEKQLADHADYSETPFLNYLAAARAAHKVQAPERRDAMLSKALASDPKSRLAVGVSQAEMLLDDGLLEQAQHTLASLRELSPRNTHVLKLLARTLYRQENWEGLLELMPDLLKHDLLASSERMQALQGAALRGLFDKYARRQDREMMQYLWGKVPAAIREQPEAMVVYASALHEAGADAECARFINTVHSRQWVAGLAALYGRIRHPKLDAAIVQAEQWLVRQPDNPVNLLLLGRLHREQMLWGVAKSYYETSLNQAPDAEGYLELAEMLENMNEPDNAALCYRVGLRYSILRKGERLLLAPSRRNRRVAEG